MSHQKKSSILSPHSKRVKRKKSEETPPKKTSQKLPIFFFLDPILSYRIYGDFLIPNHQFTLGGPVYDFKEYLYFKSITQIHIRQKGVVFQFNENFPDYITPLNFLRDRLNSVGNVHCHDLAEYLPTFYDHFERAESITPSITIRVLENDPILNDISTYTLILKEVDKIFDLFPNDLLFVSVHQHRLLDSRLRMLCMNNEVKETLILEKNIEKPLENDLIDQMLEAFTSESLNDYVKEFTEFIKSFPIKGSIIGYNLFNDFYFRDLNTIFGKTREKIRLQSFPININGWNFNLVCSIVKFEEHSVFLKNCLKMKKFSEAPEGKLKNNKDWATLYSFYYPNPLQ